MQNVLLPNIARVLNLNLLSMDVNQHNRTVFYLLFRTCNAAALNFDSLHCYTSKQLPGCFVKDTALNHVL